MRRADYHSRFRGNDAIEIDTIDAPTVIPAKAGIHAALNEHECAFAAMTAGMVPKRRADYRPRLRRQYRDARGVPGIGVIGPRCFLSGRQSDGLSWAGT